MKFSEPISLIEFAIKMTDERVEELNRLNSYGFNSYESIKAQLEFLRDFFLGKNSDREKLSQINLGLLAVREFDETDPAFANILHKVNYVVDQKKRGLKVIWSVVNDEKE